jgi:hypothetical protein
MKNTKKVLRNGTLEISCKKIVDFTNLLLILQVERETFTNISQLPIREIRDDISSKIKEEL